MNKVLSILALSLASASAMAADPYLLSFELVQDGKTTATMNTHAEGGAVRYKTMIEHGDEFSGECSALATSDGRILLRVKAEIVHPIKADEIAVDHAVGSAPNTETHSTVQQQVVAGGQRTEFMSFTGADNKKFALYITATPLDSNRG